MATYGAPPLVDLVDYHKEVADALRAMDASFEVGGDDSAAVAVLESHLRGPVSHQVFSALPYGRAGLLAKVRRQLAQPGPQVPSDPTRRSRLLRILLLHQIDVMWWSSLSPYQNTAEIKAAPELLWLPALKRSGTLRFDFASQPVGLLGRGRNYVTHRVAPRRRPRDPGMHFLYARAEIVALLNEIAATLEERATSETPALWATSIVRSVEYQQHLHELGYPTMTPSSHCLGFAADVEMAWLEKFGASETLQSILLEYLHRGVLNVIDEGQAWHMCLNPEYVGGYQDN